MQSSAATRGSGPVDAPPWRAAASPAGHNVAPASGHHPPLEEYLKAIYVLLEEGVQVIQARLVERLHHSPQAVSEMVRRLAQEGYLQSTDRGLELSKSGEVIASTVIRRHRLAERFLVDIVGLPWLEAHEEAGRWEHVISDNVEVRFVELLGNPTTCPHGNPIPGTPRDTEPQRAMTEIGMGDHVRLARITEQVEDDPQALSYLSDLGLLPGRGARVRSRGPDGTLMLELEDPPATVAIGNALSSQLYVTRA